MKYVIAIALYILMVFPLQADVIKDKIALGCVEKDVAKTAAAEMVKYIDAINNQNNIPFSEDCEIFTQGELVEIIERPENEEFLKAQRPAQIKTFWLPIASVAKEEATKETKKEEAPKEEKK